MAYYPEGPRLNDLARPLEILATMDESSRRCYSDPPPPYTSGETTQVPSPNIPSEEERKVQQTKERSNSTVYWQFYYQEEDEEKRLRDANEDGKLGTGPFDFGRAAADAVKKRWIEQGIWNNKWVSLSAARWKHEGPLENESESELDPQLESSRPLFGNQPKKARCPKSDFEKQRVAERRVKQERDREASRPNHQFTYQVHQEQCQLEDNAKRRGIANLDVNARAYQNVKKRWINRGIWNSRWGEIPGMSWKHESPLEQQVSDSPTPIPAGGSHPDGVHSVTMSTANVPAPMDDEDFDILRRGPEVSPTLGLGPIVSAGRKVNVHNRILRSDFKRQGGLKTINNKSVLPMSTQPQPGFNRNTLLPTPLQKLQQRNRKSCPKSKRGQSTASARPMGSVNASQTRGKTNCQIHPPQSNISHETVLISALSKPQEPGFDTPKGYILPTNLRRSARISNLKALSSNLTHGSEPSQPKPKRYVADDTDVMSSVKTGEKSKKRKRKSN